MSTVKLTVSLDCGHKIAPPPNTGATGYAVTQEGKRICYVCCAERDRETMIRTGHSRNLPLYLQGAEVTNWPGSLRFPVYYQRKGRHNIGRTRVDVWFNGPDGYVWHGTQIGENNTIVHARRTKTKIQPPTRS